jgi:hypothetical protein
MYFIVVGSFAVATWKLSDAPWVIDNSHILDGRPFCISNEMPLNMPGE